jgi:hypothetical protein
MKNSTQTSREAQADQVAGETAERLEKPPAQDMFSNAPNPGLGARLEAGTAEPTASRVEGPTYPRGAELPGLEPGVGRGEFKTAGTRGICTRCHIERVLDVRSAMCVPCHGAP